MKDKSQSTSLVSAHKKIPVRITIEWGDQYNRSRTINHGSLGAKQLALLLGIAWCTVQKRVQRGWGWGEAMEPELRKRDRAPKLYKPCRVHGNGGLDNLFND